MGGVGSGTVVSTDGPTTDVDVGSTVVEVTSGPIGRDGDGFVVVVGAVVDDVGSVVVVVVVEVLGVTVTVHGSGGGSGRTNT